MSFNWSLSQSGQAPFTPWPNVPSSHDSSTADSDLKILPYQPAPPERTEGRKQKAPTLRDSDWEPLKARIIQLYVDEGITIPLMQDVLKQEFGFHATKRQFLSRIRKWGLDKNNKASESRFMTQKQNYRRTHEPHKPEYKFRVRGRPQSPRKYERWEARMDAKQVVMSPGPPETPSEVSYWTGSPETTAQMPAEPPTPLSLSQQTTCTTVNSSVDPTLWDMATQPDFAGQDFLPLDSYIQDLYPSSTVAANGAPNIPRSTPNVVRHRQDKEEALRREIQELEEVHGKRNLQVLVKMRSLFWILVEQCQYRSAEEVGRERILSHKLMPETSQEGSAALADMAELFLLKGSYDEAESAALEACASTTAFRIGDSVNIESQIILSTVYRFTGRFEEASQLLLRLFETFITAKQPGTRPMGFITGNLAYVSCELGKLDEARTWAEKAVYHGNVFARDSFATVLLCEGQWANAEKICLGNIAELEALLGRKDFCRSRCLVTLGLAYARQGEWDKSETCFEEAINIFKRLFGHGHPSIVGILAQKCEMYVQQQRWDRVEDAMNEYYRSRATGCMTLFDSDFWFIWAEAEVLNARGQYEEAKEKADKITGRADSVKQTHLFVLRANDLMARILRNLGELEESAKIAIINNEFSRRIFGVSNPETLKCMDSLARTWFSKGDTTSAVHLMKQCVSAFTQMAGSEHYLTIKCAATLKEWAWVDSSWDTAGWIRGQPADHQFGAPGFAFHGAEGVHVYY